jgi:rubrerythrin
MEILEELEKVAYSEKDVADEIEFNDKEEADAIINYNRLLEITRESDIDKSKKDRIESEIYEIIGDELNHQERLKMLYSLVTGIKENKE